MADTRGEGSKIFRKSAISRIASADDLDRYIKVTNPSAWLILAAALCIVAGLGIWSATAIIPSTIQVTGVGVGKSAWCWVDEETAQKITEDGAAIVVAGTRASNIEVESVPLSAAEVKEELGSDYASEVLTLANWSYQVSMSVPNNLTDDEDLKFLPMSITVSETHPLNLVLNPDGR